MKAHYSRRVLSLAVASTVAGWSGSLLAAAPGVDGTLDTAYGTPVAVQAIGTTFGDNSSELDAAYVRVFDGKLYLMLTGNLESNSNKMEIFFDTTAGGQNQLRNDNPSVDFNQLNSNLAGMKFDTTFSPDHYLTFNRNQQDVYVSYSQLNTGGGGVGGYLGNIHTDTNNAPLNGTITPGDPALPTVTIGYNDSNSLGVVGGTSTTDAAGATTAFTGAEVAINLASLGITGDFAISVMINGSSHDFLSNQFLGGLPDTYGNLGSPSTTDLSSHPGDQFFNVNFVDASSESWGIDATGTWSSGTNWKRGLSPNAVGDAANFGSAITSAQTVTVDGAQTVSTIYFNNTNSYTVAGTSAVTLDTSSGNAAINDLQGSHTISAPLTLAKDTTVTVTNAADTLTVSDLQTTAQSITKAGSGTLVVNTVRATGLSVNAGTVKIAVSDADGAGPGVQGAPASVAKVTNLSIATSAKLDLGNNALVIPAGGNLNGSSVTVDTLRAAIIAGRGSVGTGGATWSNNGGIGSSSFTLESANSVGYVWNADPNLLILGGITTVNGESLTSSDYAVKFTKAGDANLDGIVDNIDVGIIGLRYLSALGNQWYQGDFNYDGVVNNDDVAILGLAYAPSASPLSPSFQAPLSENFSAAASVVPEPTSLGLLAVGAMGLLRRRRS